MKKILVTGSGGLIGSEVVRFFDRKGWKVLGVDNNLREFFFGVQGSVLWNVEHLKNTTKNYSHLALDIRNRREILDLLKQERPELIVHAAAQPSHDRAASIPFEDFDTNASGTLNLLEGTRQYCAESTFVYLSTNKVYRCRRASCCAVYWHHRRGRTRRL